MYQRDLKAFSSQVLVDSALEDIGQSDEESLEPDPVVSFYAELPLPLQVAMTNFIERYPNWDQYRLIQAALAGFLVQNGVESRAITRLYIGNMFGSRSYLENA